MVRLALLLVLCFASTVPARADTVSEALNQAIAAFDKARPHLGTSAMGVDVAAYGAALTLGQFASPHWGGRQVLDIVTAGGVGGDCARFAAYVRIPPQDGVVRLVICPQFLAPGAEALRRLTILHEMVHVVAGPDECRAMAFAARIEQLAFGQFTPVERYWQANGCASSRFAMP